MGCKMLLSHQLPSPCQSFQALEEVIREHRYATEVSFVPAAGWSPPWAKEISAVPTGLCLFFTSSCSLSIFPNPSQLFDAKVQAGHFPDGAIRKGNKHIFIYFFPSCRAGEVLKGWVCFSGNQDPWGICLPCLILGLRWNSSIFLQMIAVSQKKEKVLDNLCKRKGLCKKKRLMQKKSKSILF